MESIILKSRYTSALTISLVYLIISSLYIVFSDRIILQVLGHSVSGQILSTVQSYKGLAFVLITSVLLFGFIQREINAKLKYINDLASKKVKLEISETKFRALYETMAQGVTYQNPDGYITDANPAALEILGLTLDQMQGKTSFDPDWKSIHEDGTDFHGSEHPSIQALKTGKAINNVVMGVFNTSKGECRWIKIDAIPQFREGETKPHQVFTTFDDITTAKKLELSLKENESRYTKAQKLGRVGNWDYNLQTTHFWGSEEAKQIYGFDPSEHEFTTEFVESCIPERERVHQALVDLIEHNIGYNLEYRVYPKNGSGPKIVNSIAELIRDADGNPLKVMGVILDITQQKQIEETIRQSESILTASQKMAKVGGWQWDAEKQKMFWTDETYQIHELKMDSFEMGSEALINESLKCYDEEDRKKIAAAFINCVNTGEGYEFTVPFTTAKGKKLWIQTSAEAIVENGKVRKVTGVIQDVTESKNAQEALRLSEAHFHSLMDNMQGFVLYRLHHNLNLNKVNVHLVSASIKEMLGVTNPYDLNEWFANIHPDDLDRITEANSISIEKGQPFDQVMRIRYPDKEKYRWVHAISYPVLSENDNSFYFNGIIIDITQQKLAEEKLVNSEKDIRKALNELERSEFLLNEAGRMAKIGAWEFDLATQQTRWSEQVFALHAIPVGKVPDFDYIMGCYINGSEDILRKAVEECISERKIYDLELRFLNARNEKLWVHAIGYPIANDKDEIISLRGVVQDITELKESILQLEASEKTLKDVVIELERREFLLNETGRLAKVGGWDLDLATMTPYFSEETYRIYDIPIGIPPKVEDGINFYAPEARPIIQHAVAEAIEKKKDYDLEVPFITGKGKRIWVRTMGQVQEQKGKAVRMFGAIQDITEQKIALEKLTESEKKYKTLFENQPTIIWEEDFSEVKQGLEQLKKEGINDFAEYFDKHPEAVRELAAKVIIVEINETSLEILEAESKADVIKNLPYYFDSDEAWKVFKEELIRLAEGATFFESEIPVRTIKGNHKQLFLKLVVHPDSISDLTRVLITFQDITEIKHSEIMRNELTERLLIEQERLLEAQTIARVGSWETELPSLKVTWSKETHRIFGTDPETFHPIHTDFLELVHPEDRKRVDEAFVASFNDNSAHEIEHRILTRYGDEKIVLERWSVIQNDEGVQLRVLGTCQDITERVEREKEIQNYQKSLQNLTAELSIVEEKQRKEIAANIHDHLSQSLVISRMKLNDVEKEIVNKKNKVQLRSIIGHISEALESSRKITYELSPPILYELGLIETLYWLAEKIQHEHNLKVSFKTEFEELNLSEPELILLFRSIQELINNIIKHAQAKNISINVVKKEKGINIIIRDDGRGFDSEKLPIITSKGGFGLFTVKERVQNLKGQFSINSEKGKGTETNIYVPLETTNL